MSIGANVRSIQTLADLKTALARYGADAQQMLAQMERTIEQTRQSLAERQRHWQQQVRRCEESVVQARAALSRCQNSAYTDREGRQHIPDCRQFEQAVLEAKRQLDKAVAELRTVEQAIKQVEAAIADYQRQAHRLASFANNDLKEGQALLERKINILQGYVAGGVVTGAMGLIANVLSSLATTVAPVRAWQEMGIKDVALSEINLSDSYVHSLEDFKKVSYEAMVNGIEKLQVTVRPAVAAGANGDTFSDLDAQQGQPYEQGYRRIYDAFYGDDAIRLEKVKGQYQVTNGYHRLFVAQQLGLDSLPANVVEKVEAAAEKIADDQGAI